MNPRTKKAAALTGYKICDFLNQRFGYRFALEISLAAHGIPRDMAHAMSKLARNRGIDEFRMLLKMHTGAGDYAASDLLDKLANSGGVIVSTSSLNSAQIAAAQIERRMYIRGDACGFVHLPPSTVPTKRERELAAALDQAIEQRDNYHDWADKLAEAIAAHFGDDVGEHSSNNCPWAKALEVISAIDAAVSAANAHLPAPHVVAVSPLAVDEREAFAKAMVDAGYLEPKRSPFQDGSFLYSRDQDRFEGWQLARETRAAIKSTAGGQDK